MTEADSIEVDWNIKLARWYRKASRDIEWKASHYNPHTISLMFEYDRLAREHEMLATGIASR